MILAIANHGFKQKCFPDEWMYFGAVRSKHPEIWMWLTEWAPPVNHVCKWIALLLFHLLQFIGILFFHFYFNQAFYYIVISLARRKNYIYEQPTCSVFYNGMKPWQIHHFHFIKCCQIDLDNKFQLTPHKLVWEELQFSHYSDVIICHLTPDQKNYLC